MKTHYVAEKRADRTGGFTLTECDDFKDAAEYAVCLGKKGVFTYLVEAERRSHAVERVKSVLDDTDFFQIQTFETLGFV